MSVLIKGMKMPRSCDECPCFSEYDACDVTGSWEFADKFDKGKERLPDCPLVFVPPHGRLIDADEIIKDDHQHYEYLSDTFYVTVRDIELATTIIEAEGPNV